MQVTRGHELCTEFIYIVLQNFCATVLNISKEIISNNNWCRKQLWRSYESDEEIYR